MTRVCRAVERQPVTRTSGHRIHQQFDRVDEVTAMAAMYAANHADVHAIAAISASGRTPLWMSRIRTGIPIFGLSAQRRSLGKMTLYRNVYPVPFEIGVANELEIHTQLIASLRRLGHIQDGHRIIITQGDPPGECGGTNTLRIVSLKPQ